MSLRIIPEKKIRDQTADILPFMPCAAKLPVFTVICSAFCKQTALFVLLVYLCGICFGIIYSRIIKSRIPTEESGFILELPQYRFPSVRSVLRSMLSKAADFLKKAFTAVLFTSIIIWLTANYNIKLERISDASESILAYLGKAAAVIFRPTGFGDWRVVCALISGLGAKENILSTLGILLLSGKEIDIQTALRSAFSPTQAYSFIVFVLLYSPCAAALNTYRKEFSSKKAIKAALLQTCVAYISAVAVFFCGELICRLAM